MSLPARLLLLVPAANAILIAGLIVRAGSPPLDAFSVGVIVYNLLSPIALAALVVLTAKLWPRGMPVAMVACVLLSGFTVAALLDMSSSSTGALVLLFLPIWTWVAAAFFAAISSAVHQYRQTKAHP